MTEPAALWADACLVLSLFAVDPAGLGGVVLRAGHGPVRDRWLDAARRRLTLRRVPLHVSDQRLLGGLDLAATLHGGRRITTTGLLREAAGGVLLLATAERIAAATVARLAAAMDRDAGFGVIALDEGHEDAERPPAALCDRLALHLDLTMLGLRDLGATAEGVETSDAARARLPDVAIGDGVLEALSQTALALGIGSLRAPLLALRTARAAAALAGRGAATLEDAAVAARLVLAPRATRLPQSEPADPPPDDTQPGEPPPGDAPSDPVDRDDGDTCADPAELLLAAAKAAIPPGILALLSDPAQCARKPGRAGVAQLQAFHGRPTGVRPGNPGNGAQLSVVETLRAAAPWQPLRRRATLAAPSDRVLVRREDFRIIRHRARAATTTIFAVDASGSAALARLAEAKGAVELLLGECYVRRDRVALLAFRGRGADVLLPPTRSLVRAKRSLAELPGGGGTPLANGIDAAVALATSMLRKGETPALVLLTDGRANIGRDGTPGRAGAERDALAAATAARAAGLATLVVDTSARPDARTQRLAAAMAARYLPLPYADAAALSAAARLVSARGQ